MESNNVDVRSKYHEFIAKKTVILNRELYKFIAIKFVAKIIYMQRFDIATVENVSSR